MTDVNNTAPVDLDALQKQMASLEKVANKTLEQSEELADLYVTLGTELHLGDEDYDRVVRLFTSAEGLLSSVLQKNDDPETRRKLGSVYLNLGIVNSDYEEFDTAIDCYGKGIDVLASLDSQGDGEAKFDIAGLKLNRGTIYLDLDEMEKAGRDLDEAFLAFRSAEKIISDLDTRYYMAKTSIVQGNLAMANEEPVGKIVDLYNRAMRLLVELIDSGQMEHEHELAMTLVRRCQAIYEDCMNSEAVAEEEHRKTIEGVIIDVGRAAEIFQKLVNEGNGEAEADLFDSLLLKGKICLENDKKQECLDINNEIVNRYRPLSADENDPFAPLRFALALESRGYAYVALEKINEALTDFNEAVQIREGLFEVYKNDSESEIDPFIFALPLSSAYAGRASVWSLLHQSDKARADCQKGLDLIKQFQDDDDIDEEMFAEIVEQFEEMLDNC